MKGSSDYWKTLAGMWRVDADQNLKKKNTFTFNVEGKLMSDNRFMELCTLLKIESKSPL